VKEATFSGSRYVKEVPSSGPWYVEAVYVKEVMLFHVPICERGYFIHTLPTMGT